MDMHWETIWHLILVFSQASLLALGGGTAVLGDLQRAAVGHYGWLTGKQFVSVFAITQAAPGPSMLIVSLIGYWAMAQQYPGEPVHSVIAGLIGAIIATTAMFLPASILAFYVGSWWEHFHSSSWRVPVEKGLSAVTVGLLFASAMIVSEDATAPHVDKHHHANAAATQSVDSASSSSPAPVAAATPVAQSAEMNWRAWIVIVVSAVLLGFTKMNPMVLMAVAGAMGYMKLI